MSDLINRQSAIDAFYAYPNMTWTTLEIIDVLRVVPSVDTSLMQDKRKIDASSDLISRQALRDAMYHKAFETDTEMQRWDSGCWIRYKLFENVINGLPSAEPNILDDGTLTITVPHGKLSRVNRVIVDEVGTKFCKMMYQDAVPSAEPQGDLISREKLQTQLNCVDRLQMTIDGRAIEVIPRWNVNKIIEKLPTAERVGKWIAKSGAKDLWYCSECGNTIYSEHEHDRRKFHAWCGRCGARMVEDDRQS